jgi:drug/metabolite transporter (DMT)-like permease
MTPISRGLFIMALGIALMSSMDAIIKVLADTQAAPQILFFRALFGMIPVLILAKMRGGFQQIKTKRPFIHVVRAILGSVMFLSFTIGLKDMSLANALALCFSAPFFMLIFSILLIKEQIGIHRISAMVIGFAGVVIVLQPDEGILSTGAPFMLFTAAAYALTQILARKYGETESAVSYSFWATLGMIVFASLLLPFYWVPIDAIAITWCFFLGVLGGLGHYYITEAIRIAPPSVVSPMEYTALIWAALFDWMFWHHTPAFATLLGSSVIIASGIYILWRERLHQEQGA